MEAKQEMNPTLSVIIPVYKVEAYLERCVNSVLNQDYRDLEVILVDDGSPDRCPQICDDFAAKDSRVSVVHKPNGGLSSARNAGIEKATGKYLAFLDSDDQWANGKLKEVISHLLCEEVDMLLFDAVDLYENTILRKRNNHGFFSNEYLILDIFEYYEKIIRIGDFKESACTKLVKRSFLKSNGLLFTIGITGEDSEWMMRLLRCAKRVAISNVELFICTCGRYGSIQNSIKPQNIYDLIGTIDKSLHFYSDNPCACTRLPEMEHCSYLLANAIGLLRYINDKEEKKKLIALLKEKTFLFKFSSNRKTRMVKFIYKIFGFDVLLRLLDIYVYLKKKNILNHKKRINA